MTRTGAICIQWDAVSKGREAMGLEAFGSALGYFEELSKEGRIIGHREYFAGAGGMMLLEGLLPELHLIVQEDDFIRTLTTGAGVVDGLRYDVIVGGSDQTVQEMMGLVTEVQASQGLLPS